MTRTLLLMRHAKALVSAGPDRERELAPRGHRDALRVAEVVKDLAGGPVLDLAVVSSAVRTRQTWDVLRHGGVEARDTWFDSSLYLAFGLLGAVAELPEDASTVLLVGHSPSIPALGLQLVTRPGSDRPTEGSDEESYGRLADGSFPTASVLALQVDGAWADAAPGSGALLAFVAPRDLG